MKALSIQQPWAWAILYAGKDVENRTWRTNYRGPLLIHAGQQVDLVGLNWMPERFGISVPKPQSSPLARTGGIVGVVELVDCVQGHESPWAELWTGPRMWHWVLKNPRPLPFHRFKGRQKLFEADHPDLR